VRKAVLRYMNASDSPAGSYCSPQLGQRAYSVYVHQRRKMGPTPQRGHFIRSPRQKIWRAPALTPSRGLAAARFVSRGVTFRNRIQASVPPRGTEGFSDSTE